jgi:hypothetical protein
MSIRFSRYGVLLASFLALGAAAGCDSNRNTPVVPSTLPSTVAPVTTFNFEPATLRSEVVPGTICVAGPAFGTRIIIIVGGGVILNGLQFSFTDRSGVNTLPRVTPIPGNSPLTVSASTLPTSVPIPLPGIAPIPTTSPIPFPGSTFPSGMTVPAGTSQQLPFFLVFACGVAPEGILFISADLVDPNGRVRKSESQVRVGS